MNDKLRQIEREVERDLHLLDHLAPAAPSPESVMRVKSALAREGARWRRRARVIGLARRWGAVAAAVLLAIALHQPIPGASTASLSYDADTYIEDWLAAADESSYVLAALFDEPWGPAAYDVWDDADAFDDLIETLDLSLGNGT